MYFISIFKRRTRVLTLFVTRIHFYREARFYLSIKLNMNFIDQIFLFILIRSIALRQIAPVVDRYFLTLLLRLSNDWITISHRTGESVRFRRSTTSSKIETIPINVPFSLVKLVTQLYSHLNVL